MGSLVGGVKEKDIPGCLVGSHIEVRMDAWGEDFQVDGKASIPVALQPSV